MASSLSGLQTSHLTGGVFHSCRAACAEPSVKRGLVIPIFQRSAFQLLSRSSHSAAQCWGTELRKGKSDRSSCIRIKGFSKGRRRASGIVQATAETGVDPKAGVSKYKPASFEVLISDAARAVKYGLDDGLKRMEVEFPPLPSSVSGYKGASDEFADANISLAIVMARKVKELSGRDSKLVFSDKVELKRAARNFKTALGTASGLSLGTLEDAPGGASKSFWGAVTSALDLDFSDVDESLQGLVKPPTEGELLIVVNCSTVELKGVEAYTNAFCKDLPVVLFNLELETLRSDLGLFGFPPKELQYRFLARFKPVFYIRQRDYSKSVNVAPFLINYSGALLRQYPGPWQVMLKQGDGGYVCVAEDPERFTLGQVKEELLISLGLNTEEEGSALQFLRRGYKTSTWWEDDVSLEESTDWRT